MRYQFNFPFNRENRCPTLTPRKLVNVELSVTGGKHLLNWFGFLIEEEMTTSRSKKILFADILSLFNCHLIVYLMYCSISLTTRLKLNNCFLR